ncbi:ornithine-acyl[acyl carrier protein] N-acyltransferase [Epibacterium ulvae]|uniref:L-ornithine N(alpha)-acyltransferase n=1 Tax=Epibacterium ulvae TaxID=1156985 RepID=A0A1G5Q8F0_9RHOB|nr:GNAT family N-acyltransferase [Epibacterium ulvae]SCZ57898.1 ornithine-acyl[acyl carrier protein] N-acyltransferase [Epibacterium ulvae]
MSAPNRDFIVKIADTKEELQAAQALRYEVFVKELGGDGDLVDHEAGLECDAFDPYFDHMIVSDAATEQVVGVYRLLQSEQAKVMGRYYSDGEYDLSVLQNSGRKILELGRSCLHKDYRGGMAMFHLWNGLSEYVLKNDIEVLFGTASFHGTDLEKLAAPLSLLHHNHLAPEDLRVRSKSYESMNLVDKSNLDRRTAMLQVPALIKAYLRLGGFIGDGAFVDHEFNTTDVCLILDVDRMNERQRKIYSGAR